MQILKVSKELLKKAISFTGKALAKIDKGEFTQHLLIQIEDQKMTIKGTNSDIKALCAIDITNENGSTFNFTINSKLLEKLLSKIDIDTIELHYNEKDKTLKTFTTEDLLSYTTFNTLSKDEIPSFEITELGNVINKYTIDRKFLLFCIKNLQNYLPEKELLKSDNIIIKDNTIFSTNGLNKIGIIYSENIEKINLYKIKKDTIPLYIDLLEFCEEDIVELIETETNFTIKSINDNILLSYTIDKKPELNIPEIYKDYNGTTITIDKENLSKIIDRINIVSAFGPDGHSIFNFTIKNNILEIVSIPHKNSIEYLKNINVIDENKNDINKDTYIDYKILKIILTSMKNNTINLHLCPSKRFFKIQDINKINNISYTQIGIGACSVVKFNSSNEE